MTADRTQRVDAGHREPFWFDTDGLYYLHTHGYDLVVGVRNFLAADARLAPLLRLGADFLGQYNSASERADLQARFGRSMATANRVLFPPDLCAPVCCPSPS